MRSHFTILPLPCAMRRCAAPPPPPSLRRRATIARARVIAYATLACKRLAFCRSRSVGGAWRGSRRCGVRCALARLLACLLRSQSGFGYQCERSQNRFTPTARSNEKRVCRTAISIRTNQEHEQTLRFFSQSVSRFATFVGTRVFFVDLLWCPRNALLAHAQKCRRECLSRFIDNARVINTSSSFLLCVCVCVWCADLRIC